MYLEYSFGISLQRKKRTRSIPPLLNSLIVDVWRSTLRLWFDVDSTFHVSAMKFHWHVTLWLSNARNKNTYSHIAKKHSVSKSNKTFVDHVNDARTHPSVSVYMDCILMEQCLRVEDIFSPLIQWAQAGFLYAGYLHLDWLSTFRSRPNSISPPDLGARRVRPASTGARNIPSLYFFRFFCRSHR